MRGAEVKHAAFPSQAPTNGVKSSDTAGLVAASEPVARALIEQDVVLA